MLELTIGSDINGNKAVKNVAALRSLFVSYQEDSQIKDIIIALIASGYEDIGRLLIITKEANLVDTSNCLYTETYIYNNPESGSIKNKSQLFNQIVKAQQKQNKDKATNTKKSLIWIDDMWQLYPKLTSKTTIKHFRQLLQYGYASNIHFIIGSILPYRNLLVQLMHSNTIGGNKHIVSTLGAELIYTPDGLIFFREQDTEEQQTLYPIVREFATVKV